MGLGRREIQRLAEALDIPGAHHESIGTLIQSIQFEEGSMPCFSEAWSAPCTVDACQFSGICSSHASARTAARH